MRVLGAPGEFPNLNELTAPQGGALRCENVVVDAADEYTTHRGLQASAEPPHSLSAFTVYQGDVIAHSEEDGKLLRLNAGTWSVYSGTYNAPSGEVMDFTEANGSLFFTTSLGVYRLDGPTGVPVLSGMPQGLAGTYALVGSSGFLEEGTTTVYRHSWAVVVDDGAEGRLVEGAPSDRLVVNNPASTGASRNVSVTVPIPDGLPTGAFFRGYRADAVVEELSPTDEVRQVYEREPSSLEISDRVFTFDDTTPDAVKGPGAYYAANTGEGIGRSNFKPPLVNGFARFNDSTFGLKVDGIQRLRLTLLGTDAIQIGQRITIASNDGAWGEVYTVNSAEAFPDDFQVFTGGSPAQDLARTVDSFVRAINSRSDGHLYAWSLDVDGTTPGAFLLQTRNWAGSSFQVITNGNGQGFAPALQERRGDITSVVRSAGAVTVTFFGTPNHPFVEDDDVELVYSGADDPNFPAGMKRIATTSSTTITYAEGGPDGPATAAMFFQSSDAAPTSSSGTAENAYAYTKQGEPDHWPLANYGTIANATDTLWWGQPLDRVLFLGSEAGLFRLQGNATDGFTLMDNGPWDSSVSFLGRRNSAVLDGRGYAISQQGLVTWTESMKPQSADIPIQDEIRARVAAIPEVVSEHGFLFADAVNHRLYVCLPQESTDTAATVCHMFSNGAWTRLTSTFPGFEEGFIGGEAPRAGAGVVYFLSGVEGEARVLNTRNTQTDADYQGPNGEAIPTKVTYLPMVAGEPGRAKQWTWTRVFTKEPTTKLTVCFSSESVPAEECQLLPDIDPKYTGYEPIQDPVRGIAWRTMVDKFRQRAKSLTVAVGHAIPAQPLHLLGLEVKHRAYGGGQ